MTETSYPAPNVERQDLSIELRLATRSDHLGLNQAIMARLPVCLPPQTNDTFAYAAGMTVFSHIYVAFEETWDFLLKQDEKHKLEDRQKQILLTLRTNNLARTARLHSDLTNIKHSLGPDATQALHSLHATSQHFHQAIVSSLTAKPHLAVVYAWTMYLALFNGGRWIVKQLLRPGPELWFDEQDPDTIADKYLSFWFFDDTPHDDHHGDSVKTDFKRNFSTVADLLTDDERADIIAESHNLFNICARMVSLLDKGMLERRDSAATIAANAQTQSISIVSSTQTASRLAPLLPLTGLWQSLRSVMGLSITSTAKG